MTEMLQEMTLIDWLGVLGSLVISGAYLSVTRGWVSADRPAFNLLNLGGACLILWSLWYRPNAGAILIEVLWVVIAVTALARYVMHRK